MTTTTLSRTHSPTSAPAGDKSAPYVQVIIPRPFGAAFDYAVPPGMHVTPGDIVKAPFGRSHLYGVIWSADAPTTDLAKIKPLIEKPEPEGRPLHLPEATRHFIDWVAAYTLQPRGAILKMVLSVKDALEPEKQQKHWRWHEYNSSPPCGGRQGGGQGNTHSSLRMTPARQTIKTLLSDNTPRTTTTIAEEAAVSPSTVQGLIKAGALTETLPPPSAPPPLPDTSATLATLSDAQQHAAHRLQAEVRARAFSVTLLDGVTGSGKTEVYFAAIDAALKQQQQVLVLLPEIGLSVQWLERFTRRFGTPPTVWHSDITPATRRKAWRQIATGQARLVVGARSALFLPYPELGLIIVDEEHETAFKQEEGVHYHGRDMAVARGHHEQLPVILVSATPSVETEVNCREGKYRRLHLPERHGGAVYPDLTLIDIRQQSIPSGQWLSPPLLEKMRTRLADGQQSMLFLNRRGYAPLTLCRACGHRFQCPSCDAWLVQHTHTKNSSTTLHCHHCDYRTPLPPACPECEAEDSFAACGPGVERIAEEVARHLPDARQCLMTSDHIRKPADMRAAIARVDKGEVDILIGTQMMAKGHHFPNLTLVGVIDADLGLGGGDLRAAEHTFQMLHQVAGRAGREQLPGEVVIQTLQPEHPVLQALKSHDREAFYDAEIAQRQNAAMPPYARLAAIIISSRKEQEAGAIGRALAAQRAMLGDLQLLGPAPAPLYHLRGEYRVRLLVRGPREIPLQKTVARWVNTISIPSTSKLRIDIDPYGFL